MAMEMTENDIFVHWKTAKSRKYEIDVLAQLNGTTPMKIREIIVKMGKKAGEDVSDVEGFTAYIMRELPQVKKEGEKDE